MSGNRVYRGPADRQPHTVTDRVLGAALLPATAVLIGATITQAMTPSGGRVGILGERDFAHGNGLDTTSPLLTAYANGDTPVVYLPEPQQTYTMAMAAATYSRGQELTIAASGRLAAAASGNIVVAHYDDTTLTRTAGQLADVVWANAYTKA